MKILRILVPSVVGDVTDVEAPEGFTFYDVSSFNQEHVLVTFVSWDPDA